MKTCSDCGKPIDEGYSLTCPNCGATVCSSCGEKTSVYVLIVIRTSIIPIDFFCYVLSPSASFADGLK